MGGTHWPPRVVRKANSEEQRMSTQGPVPPPQYAQPASAYGYPPPPPPGKGPPAWVWILGVGCFGGLFMVAILAAILFPVFSQAREKARQVSCLSNEKQAALGIMMYS